MESAHAAAGTAEFCDDRAERIFVMAVWLALSLGLLAYVLTWARDLPYMDDWELVPVLAGARPFSLDWLLEQTFEHRYVLGRLLLYALWHPGGEDFRAPMLLYVAMLSSTAFVSVRVARRLRGRASWADAALPLLLLHPGHHENLIFFLQLYFLLPCCLALALLFLIVSGRWQQRGGAIAAATIVVAMPLCGGMGMLWAPPLGLWLLIAAWSQRRALGRTAPMLVAAVAIAAAEALLYCRHLQLFPQLSIYPRTPQSMLATMFEVFGVAFGPAAGELRGSGAAVAGIVVLAGIGLAWLGLRQPEQRPRAWGLAAFLATGVLVAVGIGWGRCTFGPGAGLVSRYVLLGAPMLLALFFAAMLYGGEVLGKVFPMLMLCLACAALPGNIASGQRYGEKRAADADLLLRDLRQGLPTAALGQRYAGRIYSLADVLAERLAQLQAAHAGPYRHVDAVPPPACHAEPLSPVPAAGNDVVADGTGWRASSGDPHLEWTLPQPRRLCGLRIDYRGRFDAPGVVTAQLYWADTRRGQSFIEGDRTVQWQAEAGEHSDTLWIYERVDRLRFDPAGFTGHFEVSALTLLVEDAP